MTSPLVSVVIPAYNHEQFIGAAIDSVLNQTIVDLELIIVDDGSTDKTADVVKNYTDRRISYVWQENQDAFNALNRGMGMAQGKYISILNSDDIYTLNRLESLIEHAETEGSACLFSDVIPVSYEGEEFTDPKFGWNIWHQDNRDFYRQQGELYAGFLHGNFMVTTSNLFLTREASKRVGEFASLRYLHDYDYIFRVLLAYPESTHYLDKDKLLYYRIHSKNTLSEAAITGRQQDLEVIEKYMLAKVPAKNRKYAAIGSQRLRKLENEINEVKLALHSATNPAANDFAGLLLLRKIKNKICRMIRA